MRISNLGIGPEGSQVDFAGRDGPHGIDHNCDERLLEILVQHLRGDVNATEPAAIPRMTVIPSNGIFQSSNLEYVQTC
jgi:hypothetical protein